MRLEFDLEGLEKMVKVIAPLFTVQTADDNQMTEIKHYGLVRTICSDKYQI